ncbi:hypothetical protein NEOC65_000907 [Neochlamydia sp. AcF65]|nr:hypothetical protein [Neochlamydia sp. AcF65]MBS4169431.1 hypothetical protein [Neochlamydia sp. AcF95]
MQVKYLKISDSKFKWGDTFLWRGILLDSKKSCFAKEGSHRYLLASFTF